jgi:hypothetical protein
LSFQSACKHIDVLGDYKRLHDQLDALQVGCYDQLVRQFGMPDVFDAVSGYADNLDEIVGEVNTTISRGNVTGQEEIWGKSLQRTAEIYRQAVDDEDLDKLKIARINLQRILDRHPTRINGVLCNEARQLDLTALIASIASLWSQLSESDRLASKLQIIPEFLIDLQLLDTARTALVNSHDGWQAMDDELRSIEVQLVTQNDLEYIAERWPELRDPLKALCEDGVQDWARQLNESIRNLDAALMGENPRRIRDAFAQLRRRQRNRFHKVDDELLELCDRRLRPLGDNLKVVLGIIG